MSDIVDSSHIEWILWIWVLFERALELEEREAIWYDNNDDMMWWGNLWVSQWEEKHSNSHRTSFFTCYEMWDRCEFGSSLKAQDHFSSSKGWMDDDDKHTHIVNLVRVCFWAEDETSQHNVEIFLSRNMMMISYARLIQTFLVFFLCFWQTKQYEQQAINFRSR